ncbi:MAG: hypothetical protein AAB605_02135 [Patescibacteria group bacterium]
MIKVLEEAIEKVRMLPKEEQERVADLLEFIAAKGDDVFEIPEEHRPAILEGIAQMKRGEYASDDTIDELLRKPWA